MQQQIIQELQGADEYRGWIQYTHTSDYLTFGTNGDERLRITSGGQVGIGTDNPTEDLHITGNTPVIRLEDSDTSRQSQIVGIDGNLRFDADNSNAQADTNISFRTDGSEVLRITSAGVIETKTRSAEVRRMILSGSPTNTSFNIEAHDGETGTSAGDVQGKLGLFYNDGSTLTNTACISFERGSGAPDGAMSFVTNQVERLRIDSSGRVGVNTSVPENSDTMQIFATTTPLLTIKAGASGSDSNRRASLRFWTNGNKIYKFEADASDGGLKIYDSSTERLVIDATGRLLVNTTTGFAGDNTMIISGESPSGGTYDLYDGQLLITSNETSGAVNTGGVIQFYGHDGGSSRGFGSIRCLKENGTSGNHNAYMAFLLRVNGGNPTERLRITSGGKIGINQSGPFADVDITSSVEDTDNSSLAQHGIRLAHIGAANEEVIPITAGFVTQQNRARAGIGFISKTISGADGMGGAIGFYTRNTADGHALYRTDERVRITESGQFLVGATSSTGARAIIQQNSSDTNPLDQQTCADSSGLRLHNYSFSTGRYTALSMECCNTSSVQSASIVAQSTSSGTSPNIIFTQRNSNTTNAERLRIDSSGYLVKGSGLTCAFNVKGSNMARTNSDAYVCQFNNESSSGCFDSGNNFNTSTYKFVAPVSGYYYFFTNIRLDAYGVGYIRTAILSTSYHAGTTYYAIPATGHVITYPTNGSGIMTVQTSTVMYLPATHEAWVYQNPQNDTSYTVYLNESSFGGYFIG